MGRDGPPDLELTYAVTASRSRPAPAIARASVTATLALARGAAAGETAVVWMRIVAGISRPARPAVPLRWKSETSTTSTGDVPVRASAAIWRAARSPAA